MATFIDERAFADVLAKTLKEEMLRAAEPIIQQAIESAAIEMRKRVASMVVGMIQQSYSAERLGTDLRILVKLEKP